MTTAGAAAERRQTLKDRLAEARDRTDELFRLLEADTVYERPIPERHRIVFYVGHLEAFDWNLVGKRAHGLAPVDPDFDRLFAFGIDPTDGSLPDDRPSDWPSLPEIERYNRRVRRTIDDLLDRDDLSGGTAPLARSGLVYEVAIEHRLMHAETLAYMLHRLPPERKTGRPDPPPPPVRSVARRVVEVPEGEATLGLPRAPDGAFGWDNEFEAETVRVPAFAIEAHDVTNGQYLEFVRSGGYSERRLWGVADWEWKTRHDVRHPAFWRRDADRGWLYHGMFGERPLPLDWPVYVSHAEATAYARWAGKALPTEAQFHRAAYGTPDGAERPYPWGGDPPDASRGNFDFSRWDPTPVGAHPGGDSAFGVSDLVGNGWEWTATPFAPLPGFEAFPFYAGYSADFFDGKHFVIKGGSARTAACMLRRSFRNWFQPHYPYVYVTFRCVEN